MDAVFRRLRERPGLGVTSELTLAEVLPKARTPDHRRQFVNLIVWSGLIRLLPVTRGILVETADYRRAASWTRDDGKLAMPKLPDAIHAVSAIRAKCRSIVTNDTRFRLPAGFRQFTTSANDIEDLLRTLA
ncbi:hypothetical protein BVIRIDIS_22250 [Blastochloris viridis]|uniref:PIN domain-containing protein n=2 Tax=Blastochloris viridis TaxID=1079 RepID=A0A0S4Q3T5_BLAVI|nr:hypothetical protein BVIRIDIS_22250 [Blastochloris viridis]